MSEALRGRTAATGAVLLALVVSAFEGTVVTTAMPSIARELGGGPLYSWVFSAFLLSSTIAVLVCGRLADAYGRRPVFAAGMGLFLLGSALSGAATSIEALVFFRAIQGLGAGAVHPIAMTITGDLYTMEERAKVQGLFTGAWGLASLVGPLLGGFIATHLGWRWVFYVNVPPGLLSVAVMWRSYVDPPRSRMASWQAKRAASGASAGGQDGLAPPLTRSGYPELLRDPIVRSGLVTSFAGGALINAAMVYIPRFVEQEAHGTPFESGLALIALLVGWSIGSTFGVGVYVKRGMQASVGGGFALATFGFAVTAALIANGAHVSWMLPGLLVTGLGIGPAISTSMVAPQSRAAWTERGMLTSIIYALRSFAGASLVWAIGGEMSPGVRFALIAALCAMAAVAGAQAPRRVDAMSPARG